MRFSAIISLSCASALLVFGGAGQAGADLIFRATLTNDQEVPPAGPLTDTMGNPRPTSFGTAIFRLNDAMTALTFDATVFNIDFTRMQTPDTNDDLRAAHIHRGTPTEIGPVVFGFFGTPFDEGTDGGTNDVVVTPFATGVGGRIMGKWDLPEGNGLFNGDPVTLANQLPFLFSGDTYINFHTEQFRGGEVRGRIVLQPQVEPVPEPASIALWAIAGIGLIAARRWRPGAK